MKAWILIAFVVFGGWLFWDYAQIAMPPPPVFGGGGSVEPPPPPAPSLPSAPVFVNSEIIIGPPAENWDTIVLTWDAPTTEEDGDPLAIPIDFYSLVIYDSSNQVVYTAEEPTLTHSAQLPFGASYYAHVSAVNAAGASQPSARLDFSL